jgi:outer membrane protein assembly factor BamD (BamD/ComL family)
MFVFSKKTKSIFFMLLVFFSCASKPEYNYRLAKRSIEVLNQESKSNCETKLYYEAEYLYKQGLLHYNKDNWGLANEYFLKAIKKAEDAEEKNIFCNN